VDGNRARTELGPPTPPRDEQPQAQRTAAEQQYAQAWAEACARIEARAEEFLRLGYDTLYLLCVFANLAATGDVEPFSSLLFSALLAYTVQCEATHQ
jgi:hypothetical protein